MRKFLSTTAGATFLHGGNFTYCIRKDSIEFIFKLDRGIYMIINLIQAESGKGLLMANWGQFFDLMETDQFHRYVYALRNTCPKWMALAECKADNNYSIGQIHGDPTQSIMEEVDLPSDSILRSFNDSQIVDKAVRLAQFCQDMFYEILDGCPIKDWKQILYREVWQ